MFIKLTPSNNKQDYYALSIYHVVDMHRQKDERTCIRLIDGSDVYVDEAPTEIMQLLTSKSE